MKSQLPHLPGDQARSRSWWQPERAAVTGRTQPPAAVRTRPDPRTIAINTHYLACRAALASVAKVQCYHTALSLMSLGLSALLDYGR